jgi:hypothetical protein
MNKQQPDFGNDLAALNDNVTAEVGDMLQVLEQKRTASRPTIVKKMEEQTTAVQTPTDTHAAKHEQSSAVSPQRGKREVSRSRPVPAAQQDEAWKKVTTHVRIGKIELLREACLHQKLKKKHPNTVQGIVDEALSDWFRKHGYSRSHPEESVDT